LEKPTIQILLVEDFTPYRTLVTLMLGQNPHLRVIGEASDGLEAVEKAQQLKPDLVLMDIGLPKLNGLEAARSIRQLVPSSRVVFLTQETDMEVVKEALSLGAWGYIVKQHGATELLEGLEAILQGQRFVSSGATDTASTIDPNPTD
jgi:DNA-binding NarL/FixJ family response regulator